MQRLLLLITILLTAASLQASGRQQGLQRTRYKGGPAYIYRVYLADKQGSPHSTEHPGRFLSRRSVERRRRQQLPVDSTDLPVSPRYLKQIAAQQFHIVGQSRWQNTVLVRTHDTLQIQRLASLPFVKRCKQVWLSPDSIEPTAVKQKYHDHFEEHDSVDGQIYGRSYEQISLVQGHRLHEMGLGGEGMMIAVIDGGFKNADRIPALQSADIRGWRDFVCPPSPNIFSETDHGTKVLSLMAVSQPYYFVGTAPKAAYWLLRSEDLQTEQEVEEDYWVMAAEFADSVGCDLINSSLGYNEYDHPDMSYRQWQLDGQTAFVSQAASLLARKGIILVNSAGNSGMGAWKKIAVPADADNIITVGAVVETTPHHIAPFSSVGPTQDGRVKPDIVANGAPAFLVNGRGVISQDMGTSFAAPTICGLAACLWQGMPRETATNIIQLIRQSANNYSHPDNIYGYGLPNFWRAYMLGKSQYARKALPQGKDTE